jgi:hypothetical protein
VGGYVWSDDLLLALHLSCLVWSPIIHFDGSRELFGTSLLLIIQKTLLRADLPAMMFASQRK